MTSVMLITNEYPPEKTAGTAMSTQFLAEEVAAQGHRVTVIVNTRRSAPVREVVDGVNVIRMRPLGVPFTRMAQRAALLTRIAHTMRPDVVQGQSLSCGALAVWVGKALRIPSVVYIQGLDLYESPALARRTYIRWALSSCNAAVAVTEDLRRRALAISNRSAEIIPHGLRYRDAHRLDRQSARRVLNLPPEAELVLFAGRLIPLKGVEFLLRGMPGILDTHPEARLVLVGDGPHRPALVDVVLKLGLQSSVLFAGERPHEDVIRYMRAADVFVLPSLVESFGIVLVEAMSCGLPIVASDVMGIPSVVEAGVSGFLVPPGDSGALASRIGALLDDAHLRARIGEVNVRKAAGFATRNVADRFLTLWGRVLDERKRPA